jgi:phosphate transport system substrate-binding protein
MSFSRGGFRNVLAAIVLTAALLGVFCGRSKQAGVTSQGSAARSSTIRLTGAGATFPAGLYAKWADAYNSASDVEVNYVTISTGGGIKQIQDRTVDFGASDDPLTIEDLREKGLFQFPVVIGGVVLAYNLPGFSGELKLDGPTVADIFLGKVKNWDDTSIRQLNPGAQFPHMAITPVYRSDVSGTSSIFTTYLSGVSPVWQSTIPADKSVQWPTGVGRKGNLGVAEFLERIPGAIGYIEYSYAKMNTIPTATLKNKDGHFVRPSSATFAAAAANANWDPSKGFGLSLINQPGTNSWPIVGVTFILIPSQPADPKRTKAVLSFFDYVFKNGGAIAEELGYVALPQAVTDKVRQAWSEIKGPDGKAVWEQVMPAPRMP